MYTWMYTWMYTRQLCPRLYLNDRALSPELTNESRAIRITKSRGIPSIFFFFLKKRQFSFQLFRRIQRTINRYLLIGTWVLEYR